MNYSESFKKISLQNDNLLISVRDAIIVLGLEEHYDILMDLWPKWHNYNNKKVIEKIISDSAFTKLCQLLYFHKFIKGESSHSVKYFTLEEFNNALDEEIVLWRGGNGSYNLNYPTNRNWVSFTATKRRVNTFSKYMGTFAVQGFLSENEHYWVVELSLRLKDVLAYYDCGDDEVIVSITDAKNAVIIEQV